MFYFSYFVGARLVRIFIFTPGYCTVQYSTRPYLTVLRPIREEQLVCDNSAEVSPVSTPDIRPFPHVVGYRNSRISDVSSRGRIAEKPDIWIFPHVVG